MIDDFIDVLNRLLKIDPVATQNMIDGGRIRSDEMFNQQHELGKGIVFTSDKAYSYISMLGVINSVLHKDDKYNLLCACYDENGVIVRFSKWQDEKPKPQIEQEYKDLPALDLA